MRTTANYPNRIIRKFRYVRIHRQTRAHTLSFSISSLFHHHIGLATTFDGLMLLFRDNINVNGTHAHTKFVTFHLLTKFSAIYIAIAFTSALTAFFSLLVLAAIHTRGRCFDVAICVCVKCNMFCVDTCVFNSGQFLFRFVGKLSNEDVRAYMRVCLCAYSIG